MREFIPNMVLYNLFNLASFDSSVHTNGSLTNVDKFNYLKGKVFGQAREAISDLALTNDNCILAVNILKECYRNVQETESSL